MYKYRTGSEPDHDRHKWVEAEAQCENCGQTNGECTCGDVTEDGFDEPDIRGQPVQKSFYDRYGFDERDGPPEEEEEQE